MSAPPSQYTPGSTSSVDPPGYTWTGDLAVVHINTIYAACHSLRFTGLVDLRDARHQAQVTFLGGDPVEIDGGDTQMIALWSEGQFKASQSIPNLSGELTGQIEQTGSLAITKAPRLLAWVSEYRLTCDITIERPGEKAILFFRNGQLEAAEVNNKPELSALARVQGWTDGFYRVRLRPLFEHGVAALQAPPPEVHLPAAGEFDVSRSIPLDLKQKARGDVPKPDAPELSLAAERAAVAADARPTPRLPSGTDPVVAATARPPVPPPARTEPKSRAPIWLGLVLVLVGGGGAAAYVLHLPPFSKPPRPIDEPQPAQKTEPQKTEPQKTEPQKTEPQKTEPQKTEPQKTEPQKTEPQKTEPQKTEPQKTEPQKTEPQKTEPQKTEPQKTAEDATLEPHPAEKGPSTAPKSAPLDTRLIEKGRALLIDGHPHSAMSFFRKAEQANPKNALAKVLQQQALGKLGRAELIVDGKGSITIDGKTFVAPKKLKVMAGPHVVTTSAGDEEVTLKKGERRHLRARP